MKSIASANGLGERGGASAISVVFEAGARPTAEALRLLSERTGKFALSFDPSQDSAEDNGWVELLVNGLTFDCTGLAPGKAEYMPECENRFGLAPGINLVSAEAIMLVPGPHLAGGAMMFPVLRMLAWLGALLSELPRAQAVVWHGARSYNAPDYFRNGVYRWIEGGAFPGLGLTAIAATPEGSLRSVGMALFTGQEVELGPDLFADRVEGAKLILRLVNWLVENGRIDAVSQMTGPSGEPLLLQPVNNQQIIKVSKSS